MNHRYIPALHDRDLMRLHQQCLSDQQIAEEMGFSKSTIRDQRVRIGMAAHIGPHSVRGHAPVKSIDTAPPPSGKVNPLKLASVWLGRRLEEKQGQFWLDGVPVSLDQIMRATNKRLKAAGAEMCLHSPRWEV